MFKGFCPRRVRRAQYGPPTSARPAATAFAPEITCLFATATPGLLTSTGQLAPQCHSIDQTSLWIKNATLNNWITQQLGGTWPKRVPESSRYQTATDAIAGVMAHTPKLAVKESVPEMQATASLALDLLSLQTRDALIALSQNEAGARGLDSDDLLRVLNAHPIPEMCLPESAILTEGERTVAWESLLSPRAQEALTALAQQTETTVADSDALLAILNGAEESSQGVEEFPRDIPCVEDSWIAGILSPEAQAGLTAVATGAWPIEDSEELLGILNSGSELNHAEESGMGVGLRAHGQEAPEDIGAGDSWMAGLLSSKARAGLAALACHNGMVEDADELLDVLNGGNVFELTVEKDAEDSQEVLMSGEAHERNEGQQATFDEVLAELHAQLNENDQCLEEDRDSEEPYTFWGSLFERTESAMSVTSEAPSIFGANTASKPLRPPPSYYGTWTDDGLDDSDRDFR